MLEASSFMLIFMVKWSQNICIFVSGNHFVSKLVSFLHFFLFFFCCFFGYTLKSKCLTVYGKYRTVCMNTCLSGCIHVHCGNGGGVCLFFNHNTRKGKTTNW